MDSPQETPLWKTAIADSTPSQTIIRGYPLQELIQHSNFTQAIYLVLRGELPSAQQEKMLNALLVSAIDHGIAVTGAIATRVIASGGVSLSSAVAGGILSVGEHYGGAVEGCAKLLQEHIPLASSNNFVACANEIILDHQRAKKRIPGFGHRIYTKDPRAEQLIRLSNELGITQQHCKLAQAIEQQLSANSQKPLCLNVDGAIAAIISDMGFDWRMGKGIFIIARTAGFVAHAHEEAVREKPVRRLEEGEYVYDGVRERMLPK